MAQTYHNGGIVREIFLRSKDARALTNPDSLGHGDERKTYLTNRIVNAFYAGRESAKKDYIQIALHTPAYYEIGVTGIYLNGQADRH